MKLTMTSPAFTDNGMIPGKYTCDGADISPPLAWSNAPENAKTFALICDDPDAPAGTWVHWVIFNIPAGVKEMAEGVRTDKTLANGAKQGINDFRRIGYGGPCPPGGTHRYFFKLYALDAELKLDSGIAKSQLLRAMEGHILAETQMIGRYKRQ